MNNLQLKTEKKEKIKLVFLTFIVIFIYSLTLLFGYTLISSNDKENDLIEQNKQSENISNLEIVKKNAIVEDFAIHSNVGGGLLALTESYTYALNYSYELGVNEDADISSFKFSYVMVVVNNSTHDTNVIKNEAFSLSFEDYHDGKLPSIAYNDEFYFNISLQQYQSTENYSLIVDIFIEQSYYDSVLEEDVYESFDYGWAGSLFEVQNNHRPIFVNTISYSLPLDWLTNFGAVISSINYNIGYQDGIEDGEVIGYEKGLLDGSGTSSTDNAFTFIWSTITNATNSVLNVFDRHVLPGIPLYVFIMIPIIISVLFFVLKVVKK